MNQKIKFIGLLAILPLAMVALSPDFIGEADAMKSITGPQETGYTFSRTGALTEPSGEKPFGGDHVVGHYFIQANDRTVKINSEFEATSSPGFVLEGWLVDVDTGFKLSTGLFSDETNANRLYFDQEIANPWIYDLFVVTEEPLDDTDPNPHRPVGDTPLSKPFGQ